MANFDIPISGNRRQGDYVNGIFGSSPRTPSRAKNDNQPVANTANPYKNLRTDTDYKEEEQKEADIQEMMDLLSRYSGKSDVVANPRLLKKKSIFQIEQMLAEVKEEVEEGEEQGGIISTICEGVAHICKHGFHKKDLHSPLAHAKSEKHGLTHVDSEKLAEFQHNLNAAVKSATAKDKAIEGGVA